jgi:UDP-N-acetylglucosamine:LPS N-acetylglucosamine transferase
MAFSPDKEVRVLAVASIGGHWEQLMVLKDLLEGYDSTFITTDQGLITANAISKSDIILDCNRDTPLRIIRSIARAGYVVVKRRPHVIISTGALPGLLCLAFGRLLGARTIWLDSIANAEKLSMCGFVAKYFSHHCLTQWEHLAQSPRVKYYGSVL